MYSFEKCYFCEAQLRKDWGDYTCSNTECFIKYYYTITLSSNYRCISFFINNYEFIYYYGWFNDPSYKMEVCSDSVIDRTNIKWHHIEFPQHIYVTLDNFNEVIGRINRLMILS